MYYCPECSTTFDIAKTVETQKGGRRLTNEDIIKRILESDDLSKEDVVGTNVDLFTKSSEFRKLTAKSKEYVLNRLNDMMPKDKSSKPLNKDTERAYFVCNNCGYHKKIKDGTLIYSKHRESKSYTSSIQDVSDYRFNKILLRTRSYKCPRKECVSHTKIENREAVVHRTGQGYNLIYVCVACGASWNV